MQYFEVKLLSALQMFVNAWHKEGIEQTGAYNIALGYANKIINEINETELTPKPMSTVKKVTIETSHGNIRLEFFPSGNNPEISIVHDQGNVRSIGTIAMRADLLKLKEALKNV